jgi:hypothetical protein
MNAVPWRGSFIAMAKRAGEGDWIDQPQERLAPDVVDTAYRVLLMRPSGQRLFGLTASGRRAPDDTSSSTARTKRRRSANRSGS